MNLAKVSGLVDTDSNETFEQWWERTVKEKYSMFKPMHQYHKEAETDRYKIRIKVADQEEVRKVKSHALMAGNAYEYEEFVPDTYTVLFDKKEDEIVMSDTPMEKKTNLEAYENAHGRVLIGGLGIGMLLLAIQDKPEVESITVVEYSQELMDLVLPRLPLNPKVKVVHGDIFTYVPEHKYDTIYIDIWNTVCGSYWHEHKTLGYKYRKYLDKSKPNSWFNTWRRSDYQRYARK